MENLRPIQIIKAYNNRDKINSILKGLCLGLFYCLVSISCGESPASTNAEKQDSSATAAESASSDPSGKVIMAIFAHPDDESTVAPILSRYVREGAKVHLVICTDGRLGVNDFTDHEAGEGLVAMRKEEMKCAAEKLGVELIHLDYHDQLRAAEGYDGHIPHVRALIKEVHQLVTDLKPDVIITWGPDGGSNHLDHRLIGATATSVYLSKIWDKNPSLYYVGRPSQSMDDEESIILRGVDESYLTTQITFTDDDLEAAIASLSCHVSQVQVDRVRERMEGRYGKDKLIYLRKFVGPQSSSDSVF